MFTPIKGIMERVIEETQRQGLVIEVTRKYQLEDPTANQHVAIKMFGLDKRGKMGECVYICSETDNPVVAYGEGSSLGQALEHMFNKLHNINKNQDKVVASTTVEYGKPYTINCNYILTGERGHESKERTSKCSPITGTWDRLLVKDKLVNHHLAKALIVTPLPDMGEAVKVVAETRGFYPYTASPHSVLVEKEPIVQGLECVIGNLRQWSIGYDIRDTFSEVICLIPHGTSDIYYSQIQQMSGKCFRSGKNIPFILYEV
ncbi:hypothetical protein GR7B_00047 [Vibrio phage vB_VcorM_GR7B]|nr:hypothetical protein GR7B_00047 [Vibrio phage vB_VcorM_GR7B]